MPTGELCNRNNDPQVAVHVPPQNQITPPSRSTALSNPLPAIRNQRKPLKTQANDEF
jgi:hypothetical protein